MGPREELDLATDVEHDGETAPVAAAFFRFLVGLGVLVAGVSFVGWQFRTELSRFGTWFVETLGIPGMLVGSLLADGIHFPVPPQFYLFTGIAAGYPRGIVLASVLVGSEIGGLLAFALGHRIAEHSPFLRARVAAPRRLLLRLMRRWGYVGLALATLLPVSYCLLCLTGGAMCLPYRAYGVLGAMRIPRIVLSYAVIVLAWHGFP